MVPTGSEQFKMRRKKMMVYKGIGIVKERSQFVSVGFRKYIDKDISVSIADRNESEYIGVVKYLIDYIVDIGGMGPGDRIKKAHEMEGHEYSQKASLNQGMELRTGNSKTAMDYLDCSEFVCRVMAADNITSGVQAMSTKNSSIF